jgi:hypothetical protein
MLERVKLSGPVETVVILVALFVIIAGAVLVAVSPGTLSANDYAGTVLPAVAALLGPLALAKGIRLHGQPVSVAGAEKAAPEIEQLASALRKGDAVKALSLITALLPANQVSAPASPAAVATTGEPKMPGGSEQGG